MSPLIDPRTLAARLHSPTLRIIDASWYLPTEKCDTRAEYLQAHIPGAVFFDIDGNSDKASAFPHMLTDAQGFTQIARGLGVDEGDEIVVYDSAGLFSAARVWWNFRVMGAQKVQVLDGGLPAWRQLGLPLASGDEPRREGNFTAKFDPALVRSFEEMLAFVQNGGAQIVDARGSARFTGEVAEPRPGLQSGHIPGSFNLHYARLLDSEGRMKSPEALQAEFSRAGVDPAGPVVTTCGSGVTAAILALALAVLGREDIPVYDGSWAEWGARPESEKLIEKGRGAGAA